jgi:hypothetical protein
MSATSTTPATRAPANERGGAGSSPLAVARTAGVLYLMIFTFGLFSELIVRVPLIESGDAAATAANILGSESLFRIGFVADLGVFLADAAVAVLFYVLLKPVSHTLAMVAAAFRLAQTAILGLNLLNHYMALQILTGDAYGTLGQAQREALAFSYLDAHTYGYLIGLVFFGLHLAVLGYLIHRSRYFPRWLGVLLGLAAVGYLVDSFTFFLVGGYEGGLSPIVLAPAVVAELAAILWLLVRGVDVREWQRQSRSPATLETS